MIFKSKPYLSQYLDINLSFTGALVVYDITDIDSFDKVNIWVKELKKYLPAETPIVIAGNKCDLSNRMIPLERAE
jgi:Ras-related protein Rab-2A